MSWICLRCETENSDELLYCEVCEEISPIHKETESWNKACQINTIASYNDYLQDYPKGKFRAEAKSKIDVLKIEHERCYEEELWKSAYSSDSISSYRYYISCTVLKTHVGEAKSKIENLIWTVAVERNTAESYQTYLNETDLGLHRNEAYEKIESLSWERASCLKTEHAYRSYLKISLPKKHKFEAYTAINELLWNSAENIGTIEDYNDYLKKSNTLQQEVISSVTPVIKKSNPGYSEFINKVNDYQIRVSVRLQTLEEELWTKVNNEDTKNDYKFYISQFPSGKYAGEAQRRIWTKQAQENEEILWRNARTSHSLTGYRNYLKTSTLKSYQKEALEKISQYDEETWEKTCNVDSEEAYKKYIDIFPDGKNIHAAQQRIRRQESKKKLLKFFKWALVIVVISVIAIFAIKANYTSFAPVSKPTHIQTQPKSTGTSASISQIESELEAKLKGLELQKKRGKALDANELNKAKSLLNKLSGKSSKYNSFKQRIDNL